MCDRYSVTAGDKLDYFRITSWWGGGGSGCPAATVELQEGQPAQQQGVYSSATGWSTVVQKVTVIKARMKCMINCLYSLKINSLKCNFLHMVGTHFWSGNKMYSKVWYFLLLCLKLNYWRRNFFAKGFQNFYPRAQKPEDFMGWARTQFCEFDTDSWGNNKYVS